MARDCLLGVSMRVVGWVFDAFVSSAGVRFGPGDNGEESTASSIVVYRCESSGDAAESGDTMPESYRHNEYSVEAGLGESPDLICKSGVHGRVCCCSLGHGVFLSG